MNTKTALRIRKFIPKKRIEQTEKLIVQYGDIVIDFEAERISFEEARKQMNALFIGAIENKLIAEKSVQEIMNVIVEDRETYEYLKRKYQ